MIAPATADLLARLAHGLADDFLTTMYLAFTGRVVLAPAMNNNMWTHPATQENLATSAPARAHHRRAGRRLAGLRDHRPGTSGRARKNRRCGRRLELCIARDLEGETVLITAGPTQEPLDPVRYISNRSSGKMGYALAEAAAQRGAHVILVSGPVQLPEPRGVRVVHVRTALEMHDAVMEHLSEASIIVKAAAVADYHLAQVPRHKIKKTAMRMSLDLDPTPDILAELGRKKGDRLLIGFAAETENLVESARQKLESKNCDMVVANLVNQEATGFEADENEVVLVLSTGETIPLVARAQARDRRSHLRSGAEASPGSSRRAMTKDQLRQRLEFYQDLGIKTVYRRPATEPCQSPIPNPQSQSVSLPTIEPAQDSLLNDPRRYRRLQALPSARGAQQDRLRIGQRAMPGWCSSAKARAPTKTSKACRSWAAPDNCSRR